MEEESKRKWKVVYMGLHEDSMWGLLNLNEAWVHLIPHVSAS